MWRWTHKAAGIRAGSSATYSNNSVELLVLLCPQVQKSKAGTGRVVAFKEFGLVNALTVEASFCGPSYGKHAGAVHGPPIVLRVGVSSGRNSAQCKAALQRSETM